MNIAHDAGEGTVGDAAARPPHDVARLPDAASWQVEGRLVEASNVVIRMTAGEQPEPDAPRAVFKPTAGERPLDDFPPATLAHREVATWLVAATAGWTCVPETRWYVDDLGEGSLQRWVGPLEPQEQTQVVLLDEDEIDPDRHLPIAAFEADEGILVLAHVDSVALRQVALLDLVTNNADRKGSHLIETEEGLFAIDHGLTFHAEEKLRTVLWGFSGDAFTRQESDALSRLATDRGHLDTTLSAHLSPEEITALHERVDALLALGRFPEPPVDRYALPWPPL